MESLKRKYGRRVIISVVLVAIGAGLMSTKDPVFALGLCCAMLGVVMINAIAVMTHVHGCMCKLVQELRDKQRPIED
jgi:hypothetical protein